MPTNKRFRKRKRNNLHPDMLNFLQTGVNFTGDKVFSEEKLREGWNQHKDEIIRNYKTEPMWRGTMLWGFWHFDYHCPDGRPDKLLKIVGTGLLGEEEIPIKEQQYDWLKRHNLLFKGEKPPPGYWHIVERNQARINEYLKHRASRGEVKDFPKKGNKDIDL